MQFGRKFASFIGLTLLLSSAELWLRNTPAAQNAQIVFSTTRHAYTEIYVMDFDGGNQERLTRNTAYDNYPTWSPDQTKIAFVSNRDRELLQIFVMDADGMNPIRLTDGPRRKGDLDWSPDGQKIDIFPKWIRVVPAILEIRITTPFGNLLRNIASLQWQQSHSMSSHSCDVCLDRCLW